MIKSISITNVATFGAAAEALDELSQFNFLFGSNGTGKTVISRVLADEASFPSCKVTWAGGTRLEVMVYNHDFVERHFYQVPELKGVFTLGEDQVDTLTKIATAKVELDELTSKIDALTNTLQGVNGDGGKKGELSALELTLRNKCWAQKQKHDAKLRGGFEGYRGSAEKFKGKVLKEMDSNSATALTVAELEARAESVFGSNPTAEPAVAAVETTRLLAHEAHPILKKRVIGREDVDIAAIVPHPVPWTHICAMPPGVAHTPRAPRSACDTQASRDAKSGCTAPRRWPRRPGRPRGSERFGRGSLAP